MGATKVAPKPETTRETVRAKRWTRKEYERLGELKVLRPEDDVQLVDRPDVSIPVADLLP